MANSARNQRFSGSFLSAVRSRCRPRAIAILSALVLVCNTAASARVAASAEQASSDTVRRATQLLENATFGPTTTEIAAVAALGAEGWLARQFALPESPMPDGLDTNQVRAQLFLNMAAGEDQLRQRVMFALSQTLVISANKTGSGPELVPWVRLLSQHAFGNYRTLLDEVALSPTMGKYLDLAYSKKASSTTSPNENFARELLQLFTIGLWELHQNGTVRRDGNNDPVPTYSQTTVREVARALTGWTFPTQPPNAPATSNPAYFVGRMEPRTTTHDVGSKTFFGVTLPAGQSAAADMQRTLDVVFAHPNVGPFIALRLIRSLVTSNPSTAYVERVADVFADNGAGVRGDLKAVVRAVLLDEDALRFTTHDSGRLKDPVLHVIGLGRALGARWPDPNGIMWLFNNLSQRVLTPPTVFSFYSPLGTLPGSPATSAPEFQIYPPALAVQRANFIYGILAGWYTSSLAVDLAPFTSVAANPATLVGKVDHVLMFGRMSASLRQNILTATSAIAASNTRERALGALYLAAISSEYAVSSDNDGAGVASLVLPAYVPPQTGGGSSPAPEANGGGGGGAAPESGAGEMPASMPAPPPVVGPPSAPANLVGGADGSRLALTWQLTTQGGNTTSVMLDVSGALVTSVPLGLVDRFDFAGVPPGTYSFAVRAMNAHGVSTRSNSLTLSFPGRSGSLAATPACSSVPLAPSALSANVVGPTVSLSWQANGPASQFVVDVSGSFVGSFASAVPGLVGAATPGTYVVTVRAVNACGSSSATAPITVVVR